MYPNWVHLTYCDPNAYAERYPHSPSSPPHVEGISIHAPTRDATMLRNYFLCPSLFQPTRPRRARPELVKLATVDLVVSIHAPTRGATPRSSVPIDRPTRFNPRAHAGRDNFEGTLSGSVKVFQSTRPRGARHLPSTILSNLLRFQSTRPRGARPSSGTTRSKQHWFQSTRPRGARLCSYKSPTDMH